jgi:hypothetical protein
MDHQLQSDEKGSMIDETLIKKAVHPSLCVRMCLYRRWRDRGRGNGLFHINSIAIKRNKVDSTRQSSFLLFIYITNSLTSIPLHHSSSHLITSPDHITSQHISYISLAKMSSLFAFIRQDLRAGLITSLLVLSHALLLTAIKARKLFLSWRSRAKLTDSPRSKHRRSH